MDDRTRKALKAITEAAINARQVLDHYVAQHAAGTPGLPGAAHNAILEINMALEIVDKLDSE